MASFKSKEKVIAILFVVNLIFLPFVTHAASLCGNPSAVAPSEAPQNFSELVCVVLDGINLLVPVIIGLALLVFLYGLIKFIAAGGSEESIKAGKSLMFWGIIGLFVMVSVWGIVNIIYGSFFQGDIHLPLLPTNSN